MKDEGERRTWSGVYYSTSTCGGGSACVGPDCAAAGRYMARMCAYAEEMAGESPPFCTAVATPTCVSMDFDWPPPGGSSTVTGVIGEVSEGGVSDDAGGNPADGGSCCPVSWLLYACTYPDGGAGQACHNPLTACVSSQTCGEGCDRVVTGRCDAQ
jgi:hypothetical protein